MYYVVTVCKYEDRSSIIDEDMWLGKEKSWHPQGNFPLLFFSVFQKGFVKETVKETGKQWPENFSKEILPVILFSRFLAKKSLLGFNYFFLKKMHTLEIFVFMKFLLKNFKSMHFFEKKQLKPSNDFFKKKLLKGSKDFFGNCFGRFFSGFFNKAFLENTEEK